MSERKKDAAVAELNDAFRRDPYPVLISRDLVDLPDREDLYQAVRNYDNFNEDNDPWGTHDMGFIDWHGIDTMWVIDVYNADFSEGGHPLDPESRRVLTICTPAER